MGDGPFYVYELIDPRDGKPFYVGKGKGDRVSQHEKDAANGHEGPKCDRIREITASGLKVERKIVRHFKDEAKAYEFEAFHVERYGLENLTNRTPGGRIYVGNPEEIRDRESAKALLVIARKTNGFKEKRPWLYGQEWHELPDTFLPAMKGHLEALVAKRGPDWLAVVA